MSNDDSRARELTACQRQWLAHLKAWQAQDELGLKAYAEQHQLSVSALYTAKRYFKRHGIWQGRELGGARAGSAKAKLVPVRIQAPMAPSAPAGAMYRVHLPNAMMVELPEHGEPAYAARLVHALMGAPS